ncbi:hypothetical protein BABINDRAFT_165531 [Babjeviella inositovora NRRL Y-12698]|uniref:BSD domain-containing protein n=1 Tax=Babjeviella inositovora NRRL Y-12698 TaxID=984486 RepID=A0A1E3QWL6_9ASCO|nr:uncharacterized protein BABINDRAFT_165531 [Babjeviella inositovora NRRL Y-12698]ODQ82031.1 hypothetical protein BABINDRAFT_165531 [Babjeviella inositovora NRRL Y-12698]
MDYVYEAELAPKDSVDTLTPVDAKTDQEFLKLETEIEKAYSVIEEQTSKWGSSFGGLWGNIHIPENITQATSQLNEQFSQIKARVDVEQLTSKVHENLEQAKSTLVKFKDGEEQAKMMELLSSKTNTYLDSLDKELEIVENTAGNLVSNFTSFFAGALTIEAPHADGESACETDADHQKQTVIAHSRTEAQMHTLHSSPELYLTAADVEDTSYIKFAATFDIASQTGEITQRLESTPALHSLMNAIVPTKIAYADFWSRYFYMLAKIQQDEQKRAQLLAGGAEETGETEDFAWDDEEEEKPAKEVTVDSSNVNSSRTSSDVTYGLESVDGSTLDVVATKKSGPKVEATPEGEEDDDDWE